MKKPPNRTIEGDSAELRKLCAEAEAKMKKFSVPGAAIGICWKGREQYAGLGVTSVENPLPVTPDTLFQIGSISKTFLATATVMLAEAGKLDLDAPLRGYLPGFKLKDRDAARRATMRHLLTHTGGWMGDYFNDFGRGDDALQKMTETVAKLPQVTPLGKFWSYNNSGFYLAGRVLEKITGKPYETLIQDMIFTPLGMKNSFFFADDVISRRFAVGHNTVKNRPVAARPWAIGRAAHPAGGIVCSARDLMIYARFHMSGSRGDGGKRLLSAKGMAALHTQLMHATGNKGVALSWFTTEAGGARFISHSGGTFGQVTDLRISPDLKFIRIVLTNGEHGSAVINPVSAAALEAYCGIKIPSPAPVKAPADIAEYLGSYLHPTTVYKLVRTGKGLLLKIADKGGFPTPETRPAQQPPPTRVAFYDRDKIIAQDAPYAGALGEFLRDGKGKVRWLRIFSRVNPRQA